ncbi:response regulator transcription factor [Pseudorhizobium flavum]|jgi:two-component system response regulator AdeR|uniref:Two-component system response regulator AdeR n=1 Tax=Pseudorhizobium flavum TaxID=1335061 RepID=A0A7W9YZE1_9HYPH|nr:response regulator transcription factor [Pseudorhizobium flavum]MBB6181057.1 two-component system response regulator AdeR [Pseudorhizobium flavum]CAD6601533.1 DNA-binding response regulator [Pseudorhizobium flavum]
MISSLVLVVEDDEEIASLLEKYLARAGYRTTKASTGLTALAHVTRLQPDLILLDVGLPDMDGFDLLTKVRAHSNVPVIFVSAMDDSTDKLLGLKLGADDYVTKPFNPQEVMARVGAVLRRASGVAGSEVIRHDGIEVQLDSHIATASTAKGRLELSLTATEFRLLVCLIRSPFKTFERASLLDACMPDSDALDRTIDTHIANLRRKLAEAGQEGYITTVRGVGYRFARSKDV